MTAKIITAWTDNVWMASSPTPATATQAFLVTPATVIHRFTYLPQSLTTVSDGSNICKNNQNCVLPRIHGNVSIVLNEETQKVFATSTKNYPDEHRLREWGVKPKQKPYPIQARALNSYFYQKRLRSTQKLMESILLEIDGSADPPYIVSTTLNQDT